MQCQFCKEDIQEGAIKCKHCGSILTAVAEAGGGSGVIVEQAAVSYYTAVLKKYVTFEGRARRKEYWFFTLFNMLASMALGFVDGMFGLMDPDVGVGALGAIYSLAVILPSIAVCVRRLHDTNRSGWFLLLTLIPIIGWIALIIFSVQDSDDGDNRYGSNPKYRIA